MYHNVRRMYDNTNARGIMRMVTQTSRRIIRINYMRNRLKIHKRNLKKIIEGIGSTIPSLDHPFKVF